MGTMTTTSLATSAPPAAKLPVTVDTKGRVRTSKEQRRLILDEFERSQFAREAFGDDVVEHYLHFLKTEQRKFDEVVTSWERERYFERA